MKKFLECLFFNLKRPWITIGIYWVIIFYFIDSYFYSDFEDLIVPIAVVSLIFAFFAWIIPFFIMAIFTIISAHIYMWKKKESSKSYWNRFFSPFSKEDYLEMTGENLEKENKIN